MARRPSVIHDFQPEHDQNMPEGVMGAVWAFGWGLAAASGVLVGTILGLITRLPHRVIAAIMSLGAGLLLSAASINVVSEALMLAGAASVVGGMVGGAAIFSVANAALVDAKDRKRCGECKPQPSEADAPGSGTSIALGTALDAVPEALVLGVALRAGGPDLALVMALALSNLPEALSGTAGMRLASRSSAYVLSLWGAITVGTAAMTASLIGRWGSSTFRLSTTPASMSLTGSRFSSESARRPFQHGIRG